MLTKRRSATQLWVLGLAAGIQALVSLPLLGASGTVIEQSVDVTIDQKAAHSTQRWSISAGKFQLVVTTLGDETRYLFNGRTFYACGKLNKAQLSATKTVTDPSVLEAYKDGTCIVVPTNFMVRFFLSPIPSVTSVDRSDGLKLTLAIKNYRLDVKRTQGNFADHSCLQAHRSFALVKTSGQREAAATTTEEELCQDPKLIWRQALWTEVAKAVLRQPQGAAMLETLRRDDQGVTGLVLEATSKQTSKDLQGKTHSHRIVVKTTAIKEAELGPSEFNLPTGYRLFSDDSLLVTAAGGNAKPASVQSPTAGSEPGQNILDVMSSVIFCAVSGPLACLVVP